jgi:hypothetical protein
MPSPTPTCMKLKWITQTLQEAQEHIGALKSSMRVSIPLRRYVSNVASISFIQEPSNCLGRRGVIPRWRMMLILILRLQLMGVP